MSRINLQRNASFIFKNILSNQAYVVELKRNAGGWKRRVLEQEAKKDIVFQYAGKKARRADRVYVWGCSATGALGQSHCKLQLLSSYVVFFCRLSVTRVYCDKTAKAW